MALAGNPPVVSIVIAAYNRSDTLRVTLRSIQAQTHRDFDVWVIGDASREECGDVVRSFADDRFHWENLERNSGTQSGPNNRGIERSAGEWVAFLGHDDLWFPWHLEEMLATATSKNARFVHGLTAIVGPQGPMYPIGRSESVPGLSTWVPPSSWLVRRDLIRQVGPWKYLDEIAWPVDVDYLMRVKQVIGRIVLSDRLSVIKFPSLFFPGAYKSLTASFQVDWESRMTADPEAAEKQLLDAFAVSYASGREVLASPLSLVRQLGKWALVKSAGEYWYVTGSEPLRALNRLRWRYRYARVRKLRGLSPWRK